MSCSQRSSRPAGSAFGSDGAMIERTRQPGGRHRHAGRRVPRPIDDDLREGRRPDLAAPPRRRAGGPAQHGLSRARPATSPSTWRDRGIASTSPSAPSGSPRATRSRSSTRCRRSSARTTSARPSARPRYSASCASKTIRTTTKEAELAKLFTNTWRYMKFAVANQFFTIAHQRRRRLHEHPARDPRGLPARRRPARPGLRRRSVPVQGHDAAVGLHRRPLPARPGRDAGQRGPARLHRVGAGAPLRRPAAARPWASSGWRSSPSRTTRARRSATSCASCCRGRVPASCATDPYVAGRAARDPGLRHRARATSSILGAPHKAYRGLQLGGKDVVDVWGAMGAGIRL